MWEVGDDEQYDYYGNDAEDDEAPEVEHSDQYQDLAALYGVGKYTTKDSGTKAVHSDGVQRDTQEGKIDYTLMFPRGVPMEDQLIVRLAELYTRGMLKYGARNWEDSKAEDTLYHHTEALWRHFMNFFFEVEDGEDHAAAVLWNVNAVDLTRRNIAKGKKKAKKKRKKHKAKKLITMDELDALADHHSIPPMPERTQGEKDANWVDKHPPFTLAKLYEWRAGCDVTGTAYPVLRYLEGDKDRWEMISPKAPAGYPMGTSTIASSPTSSKSVDMEPEEKKLPKYPDLCGHRPATHCPGGSCTLYCQMDGNWIGRHM